MSFVQYSLYPKGIGRFGIKRIWPQQKDMLAVSEGWEMVSLAQAEWPTVFSVMWSALVILLLLYQKQGQFPFDLIFIDCLHEFRNLAKLWGFRSEEKLKERHGVYSPINEKQKKIQLNPSW